MNSRLAFLDVNKDINTDMPVMPILWMNMVLFQRVPDLV